MSVGHIYYYDKIVFWPHTTIIIIMKLVFGLHTTQTIWSQQLEQVQQEAMYHSHCQSYSHWCPAIHTDRLWNPQNNKICTKPQNVHFDRAEVEQYGKENTRYVQLVTIMVFTQKREDPSFCFLVLGFFPYKFLYYASCAEQEAFEVLMSMIMNEKLF